MITSWIAAATGGKTAPRTPSSRPVRRQALRFNIEKSGATMNDSTELIQIYIGTDSVNRADTLEEWLRGAGATDVTDNKGELRIHVFPIILIVIGGAIAGGKLLDFVRNWRIEHQSEQIITYHDGKVDIQIIDKIKNGKIIILADEGTVIEVEKVPDNVDLAVVAKAAITQGADAARDMINKVGGTAVVTKAING